MFTHTSLPVRVQSAVGREASVKKRLRRKLLLSLFPCRASRQRETFRSHRSCNGTNLYVYSLPLFFFITVIKNAATQRGGGQRRGQEEIIGWRLRSRGEALEWMGSEEIRHSG